MSVYTTNYCRNPSCQLGLTGYTALLGTVLTMDSVNHLFGNKSCFVTCPGHEAGEGVILPGGIIPGHSVCSASVFIYGRATLTFYAAINPGGIIASSKPVVCTGSWTRIILEGIPCTPGQELYIIIKTTDVESCYFWLSGIQIEDTSPAHPYCDGDQDGCEWLEGFWGGKSICLYLNPVVSNANSLGTPNLVQILETGQKFYVTPLTTEFEPVTDLVQLGTAGPQGAVKDFAVAQLSDPDPAQTYVSWNTAGTPSTTNYTYTRNWGIFYPPIDYLVSNGQLLYSRAAYAAVGWYYAGVPNSGTVNLTRVQAEILPITTGYSQPSPSAYDPPRAVHSLIKPDRLNYCPNPSIESSTADWSATGSATITQDGTVSVGTIIEYDDSLLTAGTHSLNVMVNASGDGAQITIGDLITGYTYVASAYVQVGAGFSNVIMSIANGEASILSSGGAGFGTSGYGSGPYGGINPSSDLPTSTWWRIYCIFTATADSHVLEITSSAATDISYPSNIWIDAVLVEQGEIVQYYFDGSFGNGYNWEGTANLSRSYFYDQYQLKQQAVLNILEGHVPLGIDYATPLYNTPPTG